MQQLNQIERKKYFIQFIQEYLRKIFSIPANKHLIDLLVEAASAWFSPGTNPVYSELHFLLIIFDSPDSYDVIGYFRNFSYL